MIGTVTWGALQGSWLRLLERVLTPASMSQAECTDAWRTCPNSWRAELRGCRLIDLRHHDGALGVGTGQPAAASAC